MGRKAIDVINDVCKQLGWNQLATLEPTNGKLPKDDAKLLAALNRTLRVLSGMHAWFFLRREDRIVTVAPYNLGVVRLTLGSKIVTGLDDPATTPAVDPPVWTQNMKGRSFQVVGDSLVYTIASVDSATQITLDLEYQGASTTGAAPTLDKYYNIAMDRYDLPGDFDRPIDDEWTLFRPGDTHDLSVKDPAFFRRLRRVRSNLMELGEPDYVTLWDMDDQQEHRVAIFDPFPDAQYVITFAYQIMHPKVEKDTDKILFVERYDEMILDGIEYLLQRGPEDDARSDQALAAYLAQRNEDLGKQEHGERRKRITTDLGRRRARQWARFGRGSMRVDYKAHFDKRDAYDLD